VLYAAAGTQTRAGDDAGTAEGPGSGRLGHHARLVLSRVVRVPPHERRLAAAEPEEGGELPAVVDELVVHDVEGDSAGPRGTHGVGTIAASSASPMRATAAFARSKHFRAKAIRAGLLPSSAATSG
jgi:hypothetical protein